MPPKSILKNAPIDATYKHPVDDHTANNEPAPFDRKKVIENTKLNSIHYTKDGTTVEPQQQQVELTRGDIIRAKIEQKKKEALANGTDYDEDHLKWDEKNILLNEQEKSATMTIDEPKTPYEGGFDPNNEYYRDDDELDDAGFSLGEGAVGLDEVEVRKLNTLAGSEIIKSDGDQPPLVESESALTPVAGADEQGEGEEEEEEEEESPEERHKRFEEKRKEHYHLKGSVLKQPIQVSDDEDE